MANAEFVTFRRIKLQLPLGLRSISQSRENRWQVLMT